MPKKGYHWSERLGKYRRPAVRQFMMDRQGVHIILGFVAASLSLVTAAGVFLAAAVLDVPAWAGFIAAVLSMLILDALLTHQFLRYEEVEAKEIDDDGYIDIGGYLGGQLAACAVYPAIVIILYLAGVLG